MTTFLKHIADSKWFHHAMVVVILAAGVIVGLETSPEIMARHGALLHLLDRLILGIFVAELAIKIGAQGRQPFRFFRDPWNVFDFAIVAVCFLPLHAEFAAVLRLARVLRLLRLVSALPRLQMLVGALLHSVSSMGYVAILLSLVIYIYGVLGVFLFGPTDPERFGSLGAAMLTLFQVITLEGWTDIMRGNMGAGATTSPGAVIFYFVSFILLGTMIMLNLFIGVVMNGMTEMHDEISAADRRKAKAINPTDPASELYEIEEQLAALQERLREMRVATSKPVAETNKKAAEAVPAVAGR